MPKKGKKGQCSGDACSVHHTLQCSTKDLNQAHNDMSLYSTDATTTITKTLHNLTLRTQSGLEAPVAQPRTIQ